MSEDREQATVDLLVEAGATRVDATGRNKFRVGQFPTSQRVELAYYGGYGGWQFEFGSSEERDRQVTRFTREGVRPESSPSDSTNRRMAVGRDRRVALDIARALAGMPGPAAAGPTPNRPASSPDRDDASTVRARGPASFVLYASADGSRRIEVVGGDIATYADKADAVVVSDDNYLSMGLGKNARRTTPGTPSPRERPTLGDVVVTELSAPATRVRLILSAITLDLDEDRTITAGTVRDLYGRVFQSLEAGGADAAPLHVALPLLGTGTAACSPEASLAALAETARTWARLDSRIRTITLVEPDLVEALSRAAAPRGRAETGVARAGLATGAAATLGAIGATRALGAAALGIGLGPFGLLAGAALAAVGIGAGVTALMDRGDDEADGAETAVPEAYALARVWVGAADALSRPSPTAALMRARGVRAGAPAVAAFEIIRLLQGALERLAPGADRRSLGQLVEALPDSVDASVRAPLRSALAVRNRVMHGMTDPSIVDLGVLLDASDAVLALLPGSGASEEPALAPPTPAPDARANGPTSWGPAASPPAAQRPAADETRTAQAPVPSDKAAAPLSARPPPRDGADGPPPPDEAPPPREDAPEPPRRRRAPAARTDDGPHLAALTPTADGGTRQVFKLRDFLRAYLPPDELAGLDRALSEQGYKGSFDDRLLEYCVRLDDPARKLASLFRESELRSALVQLTGAVPEQSLYADVLAQRVLEHLGFPAVTPLHGLDAVRRMFEAARRRVGMQERAGLVGEIVGLGAAMESLLLLVLRFHCKRATDLDPRRWWEQEPERQPLTLDKPSLGTLVAAVQRLDEELRAAPGETYERHRQLFGELQLYVPTMRELPTLRNHFSHERSGKGGLPSPLSDLRMHATAFIEKGLAVLEHLEQPIGEAGRLCPYLVRVERVVLDAWARRTIEATNDEGHQEVLFTEEDLRPGQVYLMNPLTNPLRVTPVLVPIGASLRGSTDAAR